MNYAWNEDNKGGMHGYCLNRSLAATMKKLKKWIRECFGYANIKIENLEKELELLQDIETNDLKQNQIMEELQTQRLRLESINKQKSRELWLKIGDRNSKFFHTSILVWRRRNNILEILDNLSWKIEQSDIANYFGQKFEELFSSSHPLIPQDMENLFPKNIGEEENRELIKIPLDDKIKETIWSLHPLQSLGPDVFPSIFYRSHWEIVKEKVGNFVKECFILGIISANVNKTFIVLIPKTDKASNLNHFWPISLCNFAYKVVAKIIASRLSNSIEKIISLNQGAFVKDRWIAKNSVIA